MLKELNDFLSRRSKLHSRFAVIFLESELRRKFSQLFVLKFFETILRGLFYSCLFSVFFIQYIPSFVQGWAVLAIIFIPTLFLIFYFVKLGRVFFKDRSDWWTEVVDVESKKVLYLRREFSRSCTAVLSLAVVLLFLFGVNPNLRSSVFGGIASLFGHSGRLTFLAGAPQDLTGPFNLSELDRETVFSLERRNLVELSFECMIPCSNEKSWYENGFILSNTLDHQSPFSFAYTRSEQDTNVRYTVRFSVDGQSFADLRQLGLRKIIRFEVVGVDSPVAALTYSGATPLEELSEDFPLSLDLKAVAKNGLELAEIVVKTSDQQLSRVKVSEFLEPNKLEFDARFDLDLLPYVIDDENVLEVWFEVKDRSLPQAQVARSESLRLKVLSSYSLYQKAVAKVRDGRNKLFETSVLDSSTENARDAFALISEGLKLGVNNTYFDTFDRQESAKILAQIEALGQKSISPENAHRLGMDLRDSVQDFLDLHEAVDDRARDRDFFPAMRNVSNDFERLSVAQRQDLQKRILSFLDTRMQRWSNRVVSLSENFVKNSWQPIFDKDLFRKGVSNYFNTSEANRRGVLQNLTSEYATWIEKLEAEEDLQKEKQKKELQQNADQLIEKLRALRQRQAEISKFLDKSGSSESKDVREDWRSNQMKQQQNIEDTKEVNSTLQRILGKPSERLDAAKKNMENVLSAVEASEMVRAESSSDSAARYLRDASSELEKKAQQSSRDSRPRRRDTKNSEYYGRALERAYIDIQRQYEVDKQFREDILGELEKEKSEGALSISDGELIQQYLKGIVR